MSDDTRVGEVWERYGELFLVVVSHDRWHEIVWLESGARSRLEERRPWELSFADLKRVA